jgi:uncharacterized membrane-anchored protein
VTTAPSPNFAYLGHHDPKLVAIATQAEVLYTVAPMATLAALRAFGELLAKRAAAKLSLLGGFVLFAGLVAVAVVEAKRNTRTSPPC